MGKFLTVKRVSLVGIEDANSVIERTKQTRESVLAPEGNKTKQKQISGGTYRIKGSQMHGFPLVVSGWLPRATLLINFHVFPLSRLPYKSMFVLFEPQLFPLANTVPFGQPPISNVNSDSAGCAAMPSPLTWSVIFDRHSQDAPPSELAKRGKNGLMLEPDGGE